MAYSIANYEKNTIVAENLDLVNPMTYSIYTLDNDNIFTVVSGYNDAILAAGATLNADLLSDGIYRLDVVNIDTTISSYYFLLDFNIKNCEKNLLKDMLCDSCNKMDEACNLKAKIKKLYEYQRFKIVKDNLYFIYNQYVQTQSIVDLTVAKNSDLLFMKDMKDKLASICGICSDDVCSTNYSYIKSNDCGCS